MAHAPHTRQIFICTASKCDPDGELKALFKAELKACGLKKTVRAMGCSCLDLCKHGTNVMVQPDHVWYAHVRRADVADIVRCHLVEGEPVRRLLGPLAGARS